MATNNAVNIATAATGKVLRAQGIGVAPLFSTATYPDTAGTSGNVLTSDGTNWISSTPSASRLVLIQSQTASNSATISFTGITSTYSTYLLIITALIPVTNATNLQMLFSNNGGSSYLSTGYISGTLFTPSNGTSNNIATSTTDIRMSGNISSSGFFTGNYYLTGMNTAGFGFIRGVSAYNDTNLATYSISNTTGINNANTAINAIRFQMSSGNISGGKITLFGVLET